MKDRLILFDIDGTILLDDGAAREAYAVALKEVYDFERPLRPYDFSGKTDPQITYMVLRDGNFSDHDISSRLDRLWEIYLRELAQRVTPQRIRLLAGVTELLDELSSISHLTLGLLTGNIERGARIKLGPHDLNRYFEFGAFGSDSMHREELPPIALERAAKAHGKTFEKKSVVVIGDSIYDVRCGVPHEATTIAVATGRTTADALEAENPDFLFHSLEPTRELIEAIVG